MLAHSPRTGQKGSLLVPQCHSTISDVMLPGTHSIWASAADDPISPCLVGRD